MDAAREMDDQDHQLIGVGLYSVSEASRLTDVSRGRITRWLRGYVYRHDNDERWSPAVWQPQLPLLDDTVGLSFLDLVEVQFIDAFRSAGVPWKTIRLAAQRAREIFRSTHPFSTRGFRTDGRNIFAEIIRRDGDSHLLDLVKSQYAFQRVISPSLYAGLDFNEIDLARRWWPLGKKRHIVLDPERSFGQPIISDAGIPTAVLADAVRLEGSVRAAAAWYEVEPDAVRDAVLFERRLAA